MTKYGVFLMDGREVDVIADRVDGFVIGASVLEFWKNIDDSLIERVAQFATEGVAGWAVLETKGD